MRQYVIHSKVMGQGMTEYIIVVALIALIAVAAIGVYSAFGDVLRGQTSVALAARPDLFDITYGATGITEIDAVTVIETSELEVCWCRELFFAPIKYVIPAVLRIGSISWFEQACYARQSIPIVAKAYVVRPTVLRDMRIL